MRRRLGVFYRLTSRVSLLRDNGTDRGPFLCLAGDTGPSTAVSRSSRMTDRASASSGLVVGGLGGDDDQLLEDGQEEVFSRAEVEGGRIEHEVHAGSDRASFGARRRRVAPDGEVTD